MATHRAILGTSFKPMANQELCMDTNGIVIRKDKYERIDSVTSVVICSVPVGAVQMSEVSRD